MKIQYFEDTDTLYIEFRNTDIAETRDLARRAVEAFAPYHDVAWALVRRTVEKALPSMTPAERRSFRIIDGSRRRRIAKGSGTTVEDVNRLLRQFQQMRKMLKVVGGAGGGGRKRMRQAMAMLKGRGLGA